MSCYICDDETFETVLRAQLMCRDCYIRDDDGLREAWMDILRANYEAYHDRYGDDVPGETELLEMHPVPFTMAGWAVSGVRPSKRERYDALKEYMYQCTEGDYCGRDGYFKSRWCLDAMLEDYINQEFGEE